MGTHRHVAVTLVLIGTLVLLGWLMPNWAHAASSPAQSAQVQNVQSLEDALFAVRYDQESMDARLKRLEQTIFGQAQSGTAEARIAKLQKVLSPGSLGPLSPTAKPTDSQPVAAKSPSTAGTVNQKPGPLKPAAPAVAAAPQPGETDYPTVTQMEQKVFGKTYAQEDITQRLARLEKQVFKMPQSGVLSDRVDNLKLVVLGDTGVQQAQQGYSPPSGGYYPPPGYGTPSNMPSPPQFYNPYSNGPIASTAPGMAYPLPSDPSGSFQGTPQTGLGDAMNGAGGAPTPDMIAAVGEIEKEVIGQQFLSDPFSARLDRLETKIFHTTSPEMSNEDRMQRILAVSSAGGAPESPKRKAKNTIQALLPIILTILPLVLL